MYNILGIFKDLTTTKTEQLNESVKQEPVYENVEPKGSITEAVKSLETKFAEFKESKVKPDFLDVDKDGDKAEPFKKAVKDKKAKKQVEEGQGPYELYNPKHPKFKANYEKYKAKNPDCTLAEFVAAMKKREAKMNEAAYDEPAAPDAEAIAKRKRLQAIKDRQEDERAMGGKDETNTPIRKVAGKAYGGAAQADEPNEFEKGNFIQRKKSINLGPNDDLDEAVRIQGSADYDGKMAAPKNQRERDEFAARAKHERARNRNDMPGAANRQGLKSVQNPDKPWGTKQDLKATSVEEVAPPGAKAERMVKHIKKGYSKDGKLTKREKGIAYATAWKAKKAGVVEGTEFNRVGEIKNSVPNLKKAKPAKLKESKVMEETDYFYEKVGKALAEKNSYLDTAGSEFADAVRKEMVAQGIPPNRARNILLMDEDFLSDVATSYGHYCQVDAHSPLPAEIDLNVIEELDEIAQLAGLAPKMSSTCESCGCESCKCGTLDEAATRKDFRMVADLIKQIPDAQKRKELAHHHSGIFKQQNPRFKHDVFCKACGVDECDMAPAAIIVGEESMDEGNEFTKARLDAIAQGSNTFTVSGKTYSISGDTSDEKAQVEESKQVVKEDVNVSISANGEEDFVKLIKKLSGLPLQISTTTPMASLNPETGAPAVEPTPAVEPAPEEVVAEEYCDACDSTECHCDEAVEEERDIELANTPDEETAPVSAVTTDAGGGLGGPKKQYPAAANRGANPMEESLWHEYEKMLETIKV